MSRSDAQVIVVGAGPYGLSAAISLRQSGIATEVFGEPMSFWKSMPRGMFLRSNWGASSMFARRSDLSLDAYKAASGATFAEPVPLDHFVAYGEWVQQTAVPDVDRRHVASIDRSGHEFVVRLADGETRTASRVVVACGIADFAYRPPVFDGLTRVVHTADVDEPADFGGRNVAVIGGGQSATETAVLLAEAGAVVEQIVRSDHLVWLRGHSVKSRLGRLGPVVYAPTDVGPLWYSRLVSQPDLFRRVPRALQTPIARRCIRPAASHWLRDRLQLEMAFGRQVTGATQSADGIRLEIDDGSTRDVDDVVLGTGYRIDVSKYRFLSATIQQALAEAGGYPILGRGLESSVPGLHFLGAPAAYSHGPTMRFVSGTWWAGRSLRDLVRADAGRALSAPAKAA